MNDRFSKRCRIFLVSLTLATLTLAGPYVAGAAEEEKIDITGEYSCRGSNAGGGTYSGKVVITQTGQTYKIQWMIGAGEAHVGIGIREGNVLSVCFVSAGGAGVVAYKIDKDKDGPRLTGRWAGLGDQKTQSETLTKGTLPPGKTPQGPPLFTKLQLGNVTQSENG